MIVVWFKRFKYVAVVVPPYQSNLNDKREGKIEEIKGLAEHHEVAEILTDMIHKDGAGSWPPNANHAHGTWPAALQPYKEIYLELAPLLPQAIPSLDDEVNITRIKEFRQRFRSSLRERVDLGEVRKVRRTEMIVRRTNSLTNSSASSSNQRRMLGRVYPRNIQRLLLLHCREPACV
jgi:hypothetical protein